VRDKAIYIEPLKEVAFKRMVYRNRLVSKMADG